MINELEKEIREGMLDLYQHCGMSRERESLLYLYFASLHNEKITLQELLEEKQTRINKAIEYIEENKTIHECNEYSFDNMLEDVIPLLNILKGSDKE